MNDKELADKVVALGVGGTTGYTAKGEAHYRLHWDALECEEGLDTHSPYTFVRDWRVFGALWEKLYARGESDDCHQMIQDLVEALSDAE